MIDEAAQKDFQDKPDPNSAIIQATQAYRQEAETAKRLRMDKNLANWNAYNLDGDFSHKRAGQSREFLPKQSLATEQITSFMQQALIDSGQWWKVETEPGIPAPVITPDEMTRILQRQLDMMKFPEKVADALKMGLLGSVMVAKVHGEYTMRPKFQANHRITEDNNKAVDLIRSDTSVWRLKIDLVRQEDWFPDPTAEGLYYLERIETDLHKVKAMARGPRALYDAQEVAKLVGGGGDEQDQGAKKANETGQVMTTTGYRKRVIMFEGWGSIVDPATGDLVHSDSTWTMANDSILIAKPKKFPFWHGSHPYVICPIIRTPKSEWHKALMDSPTALNLAVNEIFNLILDGGIMAVFGIKQIRTSCLVDESKVSNGVMPGDTLEVNETLPHGEKVIETVQTGGIPPEAMNILNVANSEFNASALTNDLRMGVMPQREVKATEVVEASQTITSMFTGITKVVEGSFCVGILEKAWPTCAQNMNDLYGQDLIALVGKERALQIAALSPEERFAGTAAGFVFKVFGISKTLAKMKDFKKITALLQTIAGSEVLIEEYAKKYSFSKLLEEIIESLDLNAEDLEISQEERIAMQMNQPGPMQPGAAAPGSQPDAQSNIPQMGSNSMKADGGAPQPAEQSGGIPQAHFPPSRATPGGQQ